MSARVPPLPPAQAAPAAADILAQVRARFGRVPNTFGVMARAPAVLIGYAGLLVPLEDGDLPPRLREQLALAIAAANGCAYCLAAHRAGARAVGLAPKDIADAEDGLAADELGQSAMNLALHLLRNPGEPPDALVDSARAAGLSDEGLLEVAAHVALNTLTNAVNRLARTPIDFR